MRKTFMYLGDHGRLGNQLWQIASTLGKARRAGVDPAFPHWHYAQHFNVPMEYFDKNPQEGDDDPGRVHDQELCFLAGVEDEICEWFKPRNLDFILSKYPKVKDLQRKHTCAVHVRRGDAIGREQWHPVQSIDYYKEAMGNVRASNADTKFVVFSDGIDWCRENLPDQCTFVSPPEIAHTRTEENPSDYEEFFLMMQCDRHIISNSTFSWWAAYLSFDPSPIYPREWFGPSYPELQAHFKANFIPPHWTEV